MKKSSYLSFLLLIIFALVLIPACGVNKNNKIEETNEPGPTTTDEVSPTELLLPTMNPEETAGPSSSEEEMPTLIPTISPKVTATPTPSQVAKGTASSFTVAGVFTDDMILQRDAQVAVYGQAPESENGKYIVVEFKGVKGSAKIENGKWKAIFQKEFSASKELGHSIKVSGKAGVETKINNVIVGDIWYVGGQSNADQGFSLITVNLYKETLDKITSATPLRLFYQSVNQIPYYLDAEALGKPQDNPYSNYKWNLPTNRAVTGFSMLGIFFANRMIEVNPDVPIGLVNVSCGAAYLSKLSPQEVLDTLPANMKNKDMSVGGLQIKDGSIYNALIHPFVGFGIRGMLFYQGESDANEARLYASALTNYVIGLRNLFNSDFEFMNVQLSSYGYYVAGNPPVPLGGIWNNINNLRNAQAKVKIDNMLSKYEIISSYDVGWKEGDADGAHPLYKKPLGDRLANIAAAKTYGIGSLEAACGPIPQSVNFAANKTEITFKYTGAKLKTIGSDTVKGFELRINGSWVKVNARIEGKTIVIDRGNADGVRYGYLLRYNNGEGGNVYSNTDNPLICFEMYK